VPAFKFRKVLRVTRSIKVFLRLDAGITRGEVPDPDRQLGQLRNLLSEKNLQGAMLEGGRELAAWDAGKDFEVAFWKEYLTTEGLHWPEDYKFRLDPEQLLQNHVIRHLDAPPGAQVSILDVGAGPLTKLGKRWEGRTVEITAVADFGITPPVQTQPGKVERLTERFPANHFDLVNMQNALDHSYDPLLGIRQMLEVVKPGGYVLLLHYTNEAENANYEGFHQWNFCADNGHFVIWNRETRLCVNDALDDVAQITVDESEEDKGESSVSSRESEIFVSLRKR
jgi:SAM-dependent methyltransferase